MVNNITIKEYIELSSELPIIDVRSPKEYNQGHIINAINIPLFSNQERAHVGTVYKQESKEAAIELGYKYVNPKLEHFVHESRKSSKNNKIAVHCWRGGMRSQNFAQLLNENGLQVYLIQDGYKAFRTYLRSTFSKPYNLKIIGGYTGSGKTKILHQLQTLGKQVVDLEAIAKHRGSAFGAWVNEKQPTSEQFENNLFWQWKDFNINEPIWIEDESQNIGDVNIQMDLHKRIRESKVYFFNIPKELRATFLVADYGQIRNELLANSIQRISKRLGGLKTKETLASLNNNDYYTVALNCLDYYDKFYNKGLAKRDQSLVSMINSNTIDPNINTKKLLLHSNT